MDSDTLYCLTDIGLYLGLYTLAIFAIIRISIPFGREYGIFTIIVCLAGDVFMISMIVGVAVTIALSIISFSSYLRGGVGDVGINGSVMV